MVILLGACAGPRGGVPDLSWAVIGETTSSEVVARFGEPDFVLDREDESFAVYRRKETAPLRPLPPPIPTIVPTARGSVPMAVEPQRTLPAQAQDLLPFDGWIKYDRNGVVLEIGQGFLPVEFRSP